MPNTEIEKVTLWRCPECKAITPTTEEFIAHRMGCGSSAKTPQVEFVRASDVAAALREAVEQPPVSTWAREFNAAVHHNNLIDAIKSLAAQLSPTPERDKSC